MTRPLNSGMPRAIVLPALQAGPLCRALNHTLLAAFEESHLNVGVDRGLESGGHGVSNWMPSTWGKHR